MGRICRAYRAFFQPLQRQILPLSGNEPLMPNQSCSISARAWPDGLRLDHLTISDTGTAGGAADWVVNDIRINNRSQFRMSGDIPGDVFAHKAVDSFVNFDIAGVGAEVNIVVTYIGTNDKGCTFRAAITGMEYDPGLLDIARDAISQALASASRGFSTRPH
jgi:hypothetical protein